MIRGKKILVGVTGSIAAYKAAHLIRLLVKESAEVKVIATPSALDFITPLTLATLSRNPVYSAFQKSDTGEWNNHVHFGLWADVMIVAPASANTLAKMAAGLCDNLLLATYLSARCPVFLAPAMDVDMLNHPATRSNMDLLGARGNRLISTTIGDLASGLTGDGRMAEPEEIVDHLQRFFASKKKLKNKKALVTAGPTYEAIDPVRFIGNHASGKMGFAIAEILAEHGAQVDLVTGPTHEQIHHPGVTVHRVVSAAEMYAVCQKQFPTSDITVFAAAVADYRPAVAATQKIKKSKDSLSLKLAGTTDIAATLGKKKKKGQIIVGFALETTNEQQNAAKKLKAKNFDFIVLNSLNDQGAGFGGSTNKVQIISKGNKIKRFPLKSKKEVAADIVDTIMENYA